MSQQFFYNSTKKYLDGFTRKFSRNKSSKVLFLIGIALIIFPNLTIFAMAQWI